MHNDVLRLIQPKVGWHTFLCSFKLPRTEIAKNQNRAGERRKGWGPTTLEQFLLNVPLAGYFKLCILFPLSYVILSHLQPSAREAGRWSNREYLEGHNTASCSIRLPFSHTHPLPSFSRDKYLVQLCKSNLNCSRFGNPQSFRPNGNTVLKGNMNYQPSLSLAFQKRQLTLLCCHLLI